MKRFLALLCLCLALVQPARADLRYSMAEGEAFFPEEEGWRYHYSYRYPLIEGDSFPAQAVNEYFELALREQTQLVLPMYANDPIMTMDGPQTVSDSYEVMLSDERLFSVRLSHRQSLGEAGELLSLSAVTFAVSGDYTGDSLTLRGVCGVGESSEQIAEAVLGDVWRRIDERIAGGEKGWLPDLSLQRLEEAFYPAAAFWAAPGDQVVFFLQPGEVREDQAVITFSYSYGALEELIRLP